MMVGSVIEQVALMEANTKNISERHYAPFCCAETSVKPNKEMAIQLAALMTFWVGIIQVTNE